MMSTRPASAPTSFPAPERYAAAQPFPHAVIDGAFPADLVSSAAWEFPSQESGAWRRFANPKEKKLACEDPSWFGPATKEIFRIFGSDAFAQRLEAMTGIQGLLPSMVGGGMHMILPGGLLDVHVDFNQLAAAGGVAYRRLNVLLFLNENWLEEWGGELELWASPDPMPPSLTAISPHANRLVVFTTSDRSYHGHPRPLACPEGRARKSLAVYYFTRQAPPDASAFHDTVFPRP